jgi:hypothetical protein
VPLVVVLVAIGADVAHHLAASASPCRRRPPPPRHAATYRLRLTKPSDRHAAAYRTDCRLAKTREKREERGPNERREKREDPMRG